MVLNQRLEQSEVILFQDILGQHSLQRWTLWNLMFHEAPAVLLDYSQDVYAFQRYEFFVLVKQEFFGLLLQNFQPFGFQRTGTQIYQLFKHILYFILKDNNLTTQDLSIRSILSEEIVQ